MWELARNIFIKGRPFYEFAGKSMTKYFRGSHIVCSIALLGYKSGAFCERDRKNAPPPPFFSAIVKHQYHSLKHMSARRRRGENISTAIMTKANVVLVSTE